MLLANQKQLAQVQVTVFVNQLYQSGYIQETETTLFCFVSTSGFLTEKYWRTVNAQREHLGPTTVGNHAAGALSPMAPMLPAAFTESFITDQEYSWFCPGGARGTPRQECTPWEYKKNTDLDALTCVPSMHLLMGIFRATFLAKRNWG